MMSADPLAKKGSCKCGRMEYHVPEATAGKLTRRLSWRDTVSGAWLTDVPCYCPSCGSRCNPDGTSLDVAGKLEAAEKRVVELEGAVATPDAPLWYVGKCKKCGTNVSCKPKPIPNEEVA
jgi:hypothetical protein